MEPACRSTNRRSALRPDASTPCPAENSGGRHPSVRRSIIFGLGIGASSREEVVGLSLRLAVTIERRQSHLALSNDAAANEVGASFDFFEDLAEILTEDADGKQVH